MFEFDEQKQREIAKRIAVEACYRRSRASTTDIFECAKKMGVSVAEYVEAITRRLNRDGKSQTYVLVHPDGLKWDEKHLTPQQIADIDGIRAKYDDWIRPLKEHIAKLEQDCDEEIAAISKPQVQGAAS